MTDKKYKYIKYPIILICFVLCISGIRWLVSPEPWMLDQVANEERLQKSFINLFSSNDNSTLPEYLKQIYRFLGLFVLGVGTILLSFTSDIFFKIYNFRKRFLIVLGSLLIANIILAYFWIPSSHFIYVIWGAIGLYIFALYNHYQR